MKLRNGRFKKHKYLSSISRENARRCLFRFLKEFGYYKAYIRDIECKLNVDTTYISLDDFLYSQYFVTYRGIFPYDDFWDEIWELWIIWAMEEDNMDSKTVIT